MKIKREPKTSRSKSVSKVAEMMKFCKDDSDNTYAGFTDENGVYKFMSTDDKAFLDEANVIYMDISGDEKELLEISDFKAVLTKTRARGKKVAINKRLCQGENLDYVEIAMYDDKNTIIHIDSSGIEELNCPRNDFFIKEVFHKPQVKYKKTNKSLYYLLRGYINLDDDDYFLFLCILITMFFKDIAHYVLLISGEAGTGKSTFSRIVTSLVDPNNTDNVSIPNSTDSLKVYLGNRYISVFDNSSVKELCKYSDILCGAVTGSSTVARKFYTNGGEYVLKLKNIIIINGINILNLPEDLLSRCLTFSPQKLTAENRIPDTTFESSFEKDKPEILYAIYMAIIKTIDIVNKGITPVNNERMRGAYEYVIAAGMALGKEQHEIEDMIAKNRAKINQESSNENDGWVKMIKYYLSKRNTNSCEDRVTSFYNDFSRTVNHADFGIEEFPKNASAFSRKLGELKNILSENGIELIRTVGKNYNSISLTDIHHQPILSPRQKVYWISMMND